MRAAVAAGLLLGLVAVPIAQAADRGGQFAVKGVGAARCRDFNRALDSRSPQIGQMLSWVAGYLTATNRYEPATYDIIAWQDELYILGNVRGYCARNPGATMAEMVRAMVRSLGPGRLTAASPPVTIAAGGGWQIVLPAAIIARAQAALLRRGLYQGLANGAADARFLAAVAAFQRAERLPVTGLPDQETLFRLFARG